MWNLKATIYIQLRYSSKTPEAPALLPKLGCCDSWVKNRRVRGVSRTILRRGCWGALERSILPRPVSRTYSLCTLPCICGNNSSVATYCVVDFNFFHGCITTRETDYGAYVLSSVSANMVYIDGLFVELEVRKRNRLKLLFPSLEAPTNTEDVSLQLVSSRTLADDPAPSPEPGSPTTAGSAA